MKTIMLVIAVLLLPQPLLADECLEGDCENGSGKGFTEEGKLYDGEWLDGEPHGRGRLFLGRDTVQVGNWQHGKLIAEQDAKKVLQRQ